MRFLRLTIVCIAMVSLIGAGMICGAGQGKGKKGNKGQNRGTAQANAQTQQQVNVIRAQVADAQRALANAQGKASMSKAELDGVRSQLEAARAVIAAADTEQVALRRDLQGIEEDLLDDVEPDSEIALAQAAFEKAKEDYNRAKTSDDKSQLLVAKMDLQDAKRKFDKLKDELFKVDTDWQDAYAALYQSEAREKTARDTSDMPGVGAKIRNAHNAQQMIAAAQSVIAQGNAKIQALNAVNFRPAKKKPHGKK